MWAPRIREKDVDLTTKLGRLTLPNPIIAASGSFGYGDEVAHLFDPNEIGAITTKSISIFECEGNPAPRVAGLPTGMINSLGFPGPGAEAFVEELLPKLQRRMSRIIISIWGRTVEDFRLVAKTLNRISYRPLAIEVDISCPNTADHGRMFAQSREKTLETLIAVSEEIDAVPLFAKLSPNVADIVQIAKAAVDGGATGLTISNTMMGLAIDVESRRPVLGNGTGGVSGAGIKPLVLHLINTVHKAFAQVPIIGTGGVMTGTDAVEMLMAGASAVGVGTATFLDPRATIRIRNELCSWCARHGVETIDELVGSLELP